MRLAHSPEGLLAVRPSVSALRVLVVDSRPLHAVAAAILQSTGNALSVVSAEAETFCAKEGAFDIIFLAVSSSTLEALVLAAHLRGIERQKLHPRHAAVIACTVSNAQYLDCLLPGSALSGALNLPWTPGAVHACLDRWRGVKLLLCSPPTRELPRCSGCKRDQAESEPRPLAVLPSLRLSHSSGERRHHPQERQLHRAG